MHPTRVYVAVKGLTGLGMGFTTTIYVPFLLSRGLSYADVALINAIFWIVIVFAEVPTGMIADGRSRAWSIRIGLLISAVASISYTFASGIVSAIWAEVLAGLASSFISGADEAWITDALKKRNEEHELKNSMASASMAVSAGLLVGGVIAALLGTIDLRIGWWLDATCYVIAGIITCIYMSDHGEPQHRINEWQALCRSVNALKTIPALRWVLVASTLGALTLPFNHYWAPFIQSRVGQAGLSYIWLTVFAPVIIGNWCVGRFNVWPNHQRQAIAVSIAITAIGLTTAAYASDIAMPAILFALYAFGRGLTTPLISTFTQKHVESSYRSTYGSLQSLLSKIGYAVVLALVWLYSRDRPSNEETIRNIWTACGLLMLIGAGALVIRLKH